MNKNLVTSLILLIALERGLASLKTGNLLTSLPGQQNKFWQRCNKKRLVAFLPARDSRLMKTAGCAVLPNPADLDAQLLTPRVGGWKKLAIKWGELVEFIVPLGYQDETGFHYGVPPTEALGDKALLTCDCARQG